MKVKVRAKGIRFTVPVPAGMAGVVFRLIPGRVFRELEEEVPAPYRPLVAKETIRMLLEECLDFIRENRGLEILHVETADGTFVSVTL